MSKHQSPLSASDEHLRVAAGIMRALAHPLRMRILGVIDGKENACVTDIYEELQIEQSVASQHLRILRQSGLVQTQRAGKFIFYSLNYDRLAKARADAAIYSEFVR